MIKKPNSNMKFQNVELLKYGIFRTLRIMVVEQTVRKRGYEKDYETDIIKQTVRKLGCQNISILSYDSLLTIFSHN